MSRTDDFASFLEKKSVRRLVLLLGSRTQIPKVGRSAVGWHGFWSVCQASYTTKRIVMIVVGLSYIQLTHISAAHAVNCKTVVLVFNNTHAFIMLTVVIIIIGSPSVRVPGIGIRFIASRMQLHVHTIFWPLT